MELGGAGQRNVTCHHLKSKGGQDDHRLRLRHCNKGHDTEREKADICPANEACRGLLNRRDVCVASQHGLDDAVHTVHHLARR